MEDVWRFCGDLPDDAPRFKIIRVIAELADLIDDIERQLLSSDLEGVESFTKALDPVRTAIDPALMTHQKKDAFDKNVTAEVLARLEFCSLSLQTNHAEDEIDREELDLLNKLVDELLNEINSSSLDLELRRSLQDALLRIRTSITLYGIHGARDLKTALQQLVGVAFTEKEAIAKVAEESKSTLAKVDVLVEKIDKISSTSLKVLKLVRHPIKSIFMRQIRSTPELENEVDNQPTDELEDVDG